MEKIYGVNQFVMQSGERYCLVVDRSSGLPVYYPNLYITTQIRNRGAAFATMMAAASHLAILLRFMESRGINLEQRFLNKEFLNLHELDDLRDFAQHKKEKTSSQALSSPWSQLEDTNTVDNGTQYSRLTTFAHYLRWYARHIVTMAEQEVVEQINVMAEQIKGSSRLSGEGRLDFQKKVF
ncbi:hypothetical protein JD551_17685 [Aeromonas caviae]|uniref:hypothetical protein n=1 Tax=Aeromonas caviae TaxID=648 RepID=UPI00191F0B11|nr:hypothetical protein [Aeromonas caviae]MBL0550814.1 hypothetical protein [Aeromonas caviae]